MILPSFRLSPNYTELCNVKFCSIFWSLGEKNEKFGGGGGISNRRPDAPLNVSYSAPRQCWLARVFNYRVQCTSSSQVVSSVNIVDKDRGTECPKFILRLIFWQNSVHTSQETPIGWCLFFPGNHTKHVIAPSASQNTKPVLACE
jgi:hypothetical protein